MSVPIEAQEHIKCKICDKFLSHFPIYIDTEQSPHSAICGRCSEFLPTNETYVRATPFESISQFLKFPCIYHNQGCVERLLPSEVPNHEVSCQYRIISCALDKCAWHGPVSEFIHHFEETHADDMLKNNEFEIDILQSYETYKCLKHNDEIFSFKMKYDADEKKLQCSLFCYKILGAFTKYFYEITVFNGSRGLSVKYPLKSAEDFQEENVTEIPMNSIKKMLNDPSVIIGHVRVFTTDEDNEAKTTKKSNPEINLDMLSELECPVCIEYIIPPIYQCITGHSICEVCKDKVSECPACKAEIKNTQNFTLEKMAYLLTYPCKFTENGCDFASKPGKVKQHQKYCPFGTQFCPLKDYEDCSWKNAAKQIYTHINTSHHDNLLEIDDVCVFLDDNYFQNEECECYIKKFCNAIFQVHYKYSRNHFRWAVQLIGPPEEASNYKFEIDILDNSASNRKMFLRSVCTPLKTKQETFVEPDQYVFLELDQIRPFLSDQLNYIIRITK